MKKFETEGPEVGDAEYAAWRMLFPQDGMYIVAVRGDSYTCAKTGGPYLGDDDASIMARYRDIEVISNEDDE